MSILTVFITRSGGSEMFNFSFKFSPWLHPCPIHPGPHIILLDLHHPQIRFSHIHVAKPSVPLSGPQKNNAILCQISPLNHHHPLCTTTHPKCHPIRQSTSAQALDVPKEQGEKVGLFQPALVALVQCVRGIRRWHLFAYPDTSINTCSARDEQCSPI